MSKQSEKYHLSLSGEYFVAAELQRRGIHSSITYGNAKKTDVIAFSSSGNQCIRIEVKSTAQKSWVVGGAIPEESDKPWVFVNIPADVTQSPKFFILSQTDLHRILSVEHREYQEKYQKKHGRPFDSVGVYNLNLNDAESYENKWETIIKSISAA